MKGIKYILYVILLSFSCVISKANDGVYYYYASGSLLVPVHETEISVAKEILTITIGKDSFAIVDVYYEFMNNSEAKTVTMAFEANVPDADLAPLNRNGIHPFVHDFTVTMNGNNLDYKNAVVGDSLNPLKLENNIEHYVYSYESPYSYGYFFEAPFVKGKNIVHHTYRYRMNRSSEEKFNIPYRLTPATRWANHQIDDFTLRIKTEEHTSYFLPGELWQGASFVMKPDREDNLYCYTVNGKEVRDIFVDFQSPSQYLEWHAKNFCPKKDMIITSPEPVQPVTSISPDGAWVVENLNGEPKGRYIGDLGDSYFVELQDWGRIPKEGHRVVEYRAKDGKGFVSISSKVDYVNRNGEKMQIVNVRALPSTKSSKVCVISELYGDLPSSYDCLGLVYSQDADSYDQWYKIKVDDKIGYVRADLMEWDCVY